MAPALARSAHAAEFFTYAAASGELSTVKALVASGLSPKTAKEDDGKTALHGAALQGQIEVMDYLLSQGADINAIDRYGESPLGYAVKEGKSEAAAFLTARGAREVHGTREQLEQVTSEIVRKQMERMDRAIPR